LSSPKVVKYFSLDRMLLLWYNNEDRPKTEDIRPKRNHFKINNAKLSIEVSEKIPRGL
jgi:hypothetical protein